MGQGAQQAERPAAALRLVGPREPHLDTHPLSVLLRADPFDLQDGDGIIWPWDVFVRLISLRTRLDCAFYPSNVEVLIPP